MEQFVHCNPKVLTSLLSLPLSYVKQSVVIIHHLLNRSTVCNICMANMDSASTFL
jgi:hypothetical protein